MSEKGLRRFEVTEWAWFSVQLKLRTLEQQNPGLRVRYYPEPEDDEVGAIECWMWSPFVREWIDQGMSRSEQSEYYRSWVEIEREWLLQTIQQLPGLKTELDLDRDVQFQVMDDYGMGSSVVCLIRGAEIEWADTGTRGNDDLEAE